MWKKCQKKEASGEITTKKFGRGSREASDPVNMEEK
jgi:hypothetical protein